MKQSWINPASVSLVVLGTILFILIVQSGWNPLVLAKPGSQYSLLESNESEGYDGQFNLYIALNPNPDEIINSLDVPAYRYQRILYPIFARAISLGQTIWVPWILPLLSLAAYYLSVQRLSWMLKNWGQNSWFALAYSLWVGITLSLRLDLAEPLAFGFVIFAISEHYRGREKWSWVYYLLAVFTKETMLVFAAGQLLAYVVKKEWKKFLYLGSLITISYAAFQYWLFNTFGQFGLGSGGIRATSFEWIPFNGIWRIGEFGFSLLLTFFVLYLPIAIVPSLMGLRHSIRKAKQAPGELVTINLFLQSLLLFFLPFSLYREPIGAFRMLIGLLLAWILFAARYDHKKVLRYAMFGISLNIILLLELFSL
jgi:hypothetical protein